LIMYHKHEIPFPEYLYTSLTGNRYCPVFDTEVGRWFLVNPNNVMSIEKIAALCNIPDEDVTLLKLRYGS